MTKKFPAIPRGLLGPNNDGLADPEAFTATERETQPLDALRDEANRRNRQGPATGALQRAADRVLNRRK